MLKVAFQMDSNITVGADLTVEFMREAQFRGHSIFFYNPSNLYIENHIPMANASPVFVGDNELVLSPRRKIFLNEMDIIFIRQNPPFDMRYITTTYILEYLTKPVLINDPKGIRDSPEKLFPLLFEQFIPPTLVTEDLLVIVQFYKEYKDIILKPLYSYGGTDVLRVNNITAYQLNIIIELMILKYQGPIMIQKFCSEVNDDKRIILLDGNPIGAIKRSIAMSDEIRTNLRLGSIPEVAELSDQDKEMCSIIGKELVKRNLSFAAIDILGKNLLEINVTSPCGIIEMNKLYNLKLEEKCWNSFEDKVLWKGRKF